MNQKKSKNQHRVAGAFVGLLLGMFSSIVIVNLVGFGWPISIALMVVGMISGCFAGSQLSIFEICGHMFQGLIRLL